MPGQDAAVMTVAKTPEHKLASSTFVLVDQFVARTYPHESSFFGRSNRAMR
jgi:hypothetical protein